MSKHQDFDDFQRRDTLSLFGDESRSTCTVSEAKEFNREVARRRRHYALVIGIPALLLLVGLLGLYFWNEHREMLAAIEAERLEHENKVFPIKTIGFADAKFVIRFQGVTEEQIPAVINFVALHAVWQKPSEACIVSQYSGPMVAEPLPYSVEVNGKTTLETTDADGNAVVLDLSQRDIDAELFAKAVCAEWNRCYPGARVPLEIRIPTKENATPEEQAELEKMKSERERFNNLQLPDDPRMSHPEEK